MELRPNAYYAGGWIFFNNEKDAAIRMRDVQGVMPNVSTHSIHDAPDGSIIFCGNMKFWVPNRSTEVLEWLRLNGEIK
jgi:hypothetical protein